MSTYPVTVAVADLLSVPVEAVPAHESLETLEVRALVASAKLGDTAAFGRLVDIYERVALRTALAALTDREDAEDTAQEAFVIAWQKLATFRGGSTFKTWLLTIVWRKALDRRQAHRRWFRRLTTSDRDDADLAGIEDAAPTPEHIAIGHDLRRQLAAEIRRLSPKLRDSLLLAANGDHSYEQIAVLLKTRVGTVKWRVSEARRLVAARIGRSRD